MRSVVAIAVTVLAATFASIIAGEYEMVGATAFLIGGIFGVAMAEVAASVAHDSDWYLAGAVALITEAGLVWSLWIGTGHRFEFAPVEAWIALVLGTVAAPAWFRTAGQRGQRTRPAASRTPGRTPPPTAR